MRGMEAVPIVGDALLAVVVKVGHVPFSKRAAPCVAVLSGLLTRGDTVEMLDEVGAVTTARVHGVLDGRLSASDDDRVVSLDGVTADEVRLGHVIRRAGEPAPTLPATDPHAATRARLLEVVRWARAGALNGPDADVLALLTDEEVVLFVERRLRRALDRHTSPFTLRDDLERAAAAFQTIGLRVDADRLRVAAAAALEGLGVAPSSPTLAEVARLGTLTTSDAADSVTAHGKGIGAVLDLDVLEGLASGYGQAAESAGRDIRVNLQSEGRAVALGWCPHCRDAVPLDARLRCVDDGKKARDVVLVVPEDLPMTQARLRTRAGARR